MFTEVLAQQSHTLACEPLGWRTPIEHLYGTTPDISSIVMGRNTDSLVIVKALSGLRSSGLRWHKKSALIDVAYKNTYSSCSKHISGDQYIDSPDGYNIPMMVGHS